MASVHIQYLEAQFNARAPIEVNIEFTNAVMADVVSLLPSFNRMDGVTVRGTFYDYQIAISALRAAIYLASGTIRR